jgi:hypothetical protein
VRASCSRAGELQGCSLTTSRLQRSGERHPVLVGSSIRTSQGVRIEGNGGDEHATASHHRDRREAVCMRQGCSSYESGIHFSTRSDSRPEKVGIEPIEGILGREVVSSNRRAVNRSWRVRFSA